MEEGTGYQSAQVPEVVKALFKQDEGGNSVVTRLQAEVECNKNKHEWEPATDTSLTCGDMRKLLDAILNQAPQ